MKTKYEKLYKYGFNAMIFGIPKRRVRLFYAFLIFFIVLLGLFVEWYVWNP